MSSLMGRGAGREVRSGMRVFLEFAAASTLVALALATLLPNLHRAGRIGRAIASGATRAPGLDIALALLTWAPWVAALALGGWRAMLGSLLGQLIALAVWVIGHETLHRRHVRGPRIVKAINRTVGRWRNHAALWVTVVAFPVFWLVRAAEVLAYPFLVWLLRFPRYRHAEWVNISRQKFEGLVGHDLIWCLYCDWMTGVYALGGEMLRNVESFWCPIRFYDGKKCENCRVDFPDIDGGWVPADGTMGQVEALVESKYAGGRREWFGHPARLTINGDPPVRRG